MTAALRLMQEATLRGGLSGGTPNRPGRSEVEQP